jgi:hypothetical protein
MRGVYMRTGWGFARVFAVLLAVGTIAGAPVAVATAQASTPSLLWTGAKRIAVNCLVQSGSTADAPQFEADLCGQVRRLAEQDAPVPVVQVENGDPHMVQPDTVVLLVHGSIERSGKGRTVAFTIRPYRPSGGEAEIYFGTAPQAVTLATARMDAVLQDRLRAAVADILPWQQEARLTARPL